MPPRPAPASAPSARDDALPTPGGGNPKLQRWVDLVASLLSRNMPATFAQLARDVPEYANEVAAIEQLPAGQARATRFESLKRTFERDKDELKQFGIPIVSVADEDGNDGGAYRLERRNFYLPYLCVAVPGGGVRRPPPVDAYGYQALTSLNFDADELQAVVDAAAAVRALGDPTLALEAAGAMRKLAVDLPVDAMRTSPDEPRLLAARARPDAETFAALGDALRRRKVVTFEYHAMSSDRTEGREVEPYGLFFLSGHWYLAGRDRARDGLRNFRLNRMSGVQVNRSKPNTADYTVPATFRLREHARSRHAWELGDGDATPVTVQCTGESGPTMAAMQLGELVDGARDRRTFAVRRADTFARWLLSFAGELRPVAPEGVVSRYRELAGATLRLYEHPAPSLAQGGPVAEPARPSVHAPSVDAPVAAPPAGAPRRRPPADPWNARGALPEFRRILLLVPHIANGEEHDLDEVARAIGTTVEVLQRDLYALVTRYDAPAGFVDGVQLYVENGRVSAVSNHLLRPMRLTVPELCALELGLAVLRNHRAPDEHAVLERARERLRAVIARLPSDALPDGLHGASMGEFADTGQLAALREALRGQHKLHLVYRKSGSDTPGARVIHPYMLVASSGMLYVVAHCEQSGAIRVFRLDRIESAEVLEAPFVRPEPLDLDGVLREGRVLQHDGGATMRIRYSPRIARWIAEREGRALAPDGSLEMEHPLADRAWGMRHVLQYGPDAEVLAPDALRDLLRERLRGMAGAT